MAGIGPARNPAYLQKVFRITQKDEVTKEVMPVGFALFVWVLWPQMSTFFL